jgi:hypothetical protein
VSHVLSLVSVHFAGDDRMSDVGLPDQLTGLACAVVVFLFRTKPLGLFASIFLGWAALLGSPIVANADGNYQRTKDGKTLVWNEYPRSGDVATWAGSRDSDGYASGFGTLTWYRTQKSTANGSKRTLYAYYFGNMVRGKFNGPVNSHSNRITSHAVFIEGKRTNRWAAGPVLSWTMPRSTPENIASVKESKSEAVQSRRPTVESKSEDVQKGQVQPPAKTYDATASQRPQPNFEAVREEVKPEANANVPAEGPRSEEPPAKSVGPVESERPLPRNEVVREEVKPEANANVPAEGPRSEERPAQSAGAVESERPLPRNEVVREEAKPEANANVAAEGPRSEETPAGSPAQSVDAVESERPLPNNEVVSEEAKPEANANVPAEGPVSEETPSAPPSTRKNPSEPEETEIPLRALTSPPAALGEPDHAVPESTLGSVSSEQEHLTKAEVVGLSDSEARKHGYDLNRYDRPKPQFDPIDNIWCLSYIDKSAGVRPPSPKYFTVAVDDKTKRTAIVPAR